MPSNQSDEEHLIDSDGDEALEDNGIEVASIDASPRDEEPDDGEDLMGDIMQEDDAELMEGNDRYEVDPQAEADDAAPLSLAARREADRALRRRDTRGIPVPPRAGAARMPAALMDDEDNASARQHAAGSQTGTPMGAPSGRTFSSTGGGDDMDSLLGPGATPRSEITEMDGASFVSDGNQGAGREDGIAPYEAPQEQDDFNLENYTGSLREWIAMDRPKREVKRRFMAFLKTSVSEKNSPVYIKRVQNMCAENKQSLTVSYPHMVNQDPLLAIWVADAPAEMLKIFDEVATDLTLQNFKHYSAIHPNIFVRISELPIEDSLREIRQVHLNGLIKVSGVVTRRTGVFPHLRKVKLTCSKCKSRLNPTITTAVIPEKSVHQCPHCTSRGPFTVDSENTIFGNFQKITLQESPGSVPAGRLPRYKEIVLLSDLIDCARPGDEVEVTGIYRHNFDISLNIRNGFPVFGTEIEANFIRKIEDAHADIELTDDDVSEIRKLAEDPLISQRVIASIAPSIYGHKDIKTAIALSLAGGQPKVVGEKHRIRGDINVLLMGDPGTAKSQFLKYTEKTATRAVYTTGKGASAVGLTAGVHKDPVTREWTLEGGALVLADRGVCLIDEFDKMNDQDRTSIHEAMEQQSISISKAGINTSLQARCAVIAAANPIKGRYDPALSFLDNVDLTEPILSRFDVLLVVRDTVDPTADEVLARFVVHSHIRSHPKEREDLENAEEQDEDIVPVQIGDVSVMPLTQKMLRKFILYAKKNVHPRISNIDQDKISKLYCDLRRESGNSGGLPIAVRHLESIIRLSEAHARLHLREYVSEEDLNAAIAVMLDSFFQSQKYSVMRGLKRKFHKYLSYRKDDTELLFYLLSSLVRDYATTITRGPEDDIEVDMEDFEARAREINIQSVAEFYGCPEFEKRHYTVNFETRKIVKRIY